MFPLASVARVVRSDLRRLSRDRFLLGSGAYLVGISLAMRWLLPWLSGALLRRRGFDLEPYLGLVISYFLVFLAPVLVGMIGGFLLLDSREDRSIRALLVSPMPFRVYLLGGSGVMILACGCVALSEAALIDLGLPPRPALISTTLIGALGAPICAFGLGTFASNKVEAFAQLKLVGASGLILVGAYFLDRPWEYLACLFPPYWAAKAWWIAQAGEGGWAGWLLGGLVVSGGLLTWLIGRFEAAARAPAQ